MWNWYEYGIDTDGNTQYCKCKRCNCFPAIVLTFQDDNEYGPFCKDCWWIHTNEQFDKLDKELENEHWGDIPSKCAFCPKYTYDMKFLRFQQKDYWVCCECYDKHSEK